MDRAPCTRTLIASADHVVVEQCSCGSVHLTIGALTLRLPSTALLELAATLGDAARAIALRGAFAPSASLEGAVS